MSFKIKSIIGSFDDDAVEVYLLDELQKAEKLGLSRIIIRKPQLMDYEKLIGQIFFYMPYNSLRRPKEEDEVFPLENVWKLIDGKPHTVRKRRHGGEVEDEAGELIFEVVENFKEGNGSYLPKKNKFLSDRQVDEILDERGKGLWREGAFLIDDKGTYGRIKSIVISEFEDRELSRERPKTNPLWITIYRDTIRIEVEYEKSYRIDVSNPKFDGLEYFSLHANEQNTFEKFESKWHIIDESDLVGFERKILQAKETGSLEMFGEQLMIGTSEDDRIKSDMGDGSTALMGMSNQNQLQVMHDRLYKKNNLSKAVQYSFKRAIVIKREEMELALSKEKEKMELLKKDLQYQIAVFEKQMKKIQRLITTLEIYMGESENVIQISEGEVASDDEPIALRQMMLYMDEEFGNPARGGLDFRTIEEFDEWLVDSGNYEKVMPNPKGVVVLRPRRKMKHYSMDIFENAAMQDEDKKFYLLIRNGENLYKIWTDKIEFGHRLFPLKAELQEMMDKISEGTMEMEEKEVGSWEFEKADKKVEEGQDAMFHYQRTFLLMQGIIMRTSIFSGIPQDFNFLNVSTHGDAVKFIYDEENILADGRKRFSEYRNDLNSTICKGSRILIAGNYSIRNYEDRLAGYLSERALHSMETPSKGLYTLKSRMIESSDYETEWIKFSDMLEYEKKHKLMKEKHRVINKTGARSSSTSYNFPSDYRRKYERGHRRKGNGEDQMVQAFVLDDNNERIITSAKREEFYISYSYDHQYTGNKQNKTFIIKPFHDAQVLNYDALALEDMDYYINSRIDRPDYLNMLTLLYELRDELKAEQTSEEVFIQLTKSELLREYPKLSELDIESIIVDAIDWWKNKKATVWKRPISKDDGKALEMVLQQVKKKCKSLVKTPIKTGTNYRESLLVWRQKDILFYAFGITKKDFSEQVKNLISNTPRLFKTENRNKVIDQVRGITLPREGTQTELMESAKANIGNVQFKIF